MELKSDKGGLVMELDWNRTLILELDFGFRSKLIWESESDQFIF
jgi:hypothetical protein